jgi:MarR family transcriptional regulator, organic hydroperoxide resistance regulator
MDFTIDKHLCFALYSSSHLITRAYRPFLRKLNLTYTQYIVMVVLWEQDNLCVKDICEKLYLDSGTLTPLLKKLEKQGFLSRLRGENDERQVFVNLTQKGKALYIEAKDIPAAIGCAKGIQNETVLKIMPLLDQIRTQLTLE